MPSEKSPFLTRSLPDWRIIARRDWLYFPLNIGKATASYQDIGRVRMPAGNEKPPVSITLASTPAAIAGHAPGG
jgi:hypothetical protein